MKQTDAPPALYRDQRHGLQRQTGNAKSQTGVHIQQQATSLYSTQHRAQHMRLLHKFTADVFEECAERLTSWTDLFLVLQRSDFYSNSKEDMTVNQVSGLVSVFPLTTSIFLVTHSVS